MQTIPIGTVQRAKVERETDNGYVLTWMNHEVLLHFNEIDENTEIEIDTFVDVFLYNDKENRVIATTISPSIQIDLYDWAEVVHVVPGLGAFVDIGIQKEMLVSIDDLPLYEDVWPNVGDSLFVTLGKDQLGRLIALPATEGIIDARREIATDDLFNTSIEAIVYYTSKEGAACWSTEGYRCFLHHTEREFEPRLGEKIEGRVIDVKPDGTLNISLLPLKQDRIDEDAGVIVAYLQEHNGRIPFTDKSDPADIQATFGFSKGAFKRALGRLMRNKKIEQRDGNTFLL